VLRLARGVTYARAVTFSPRCPICSAPVPWEGNPSRPFCSERCRLVDLGAWVTERYRVAGEAVESGAATKDDDGSSESGES
jgi:endogenous inhibitor of DNA gyrase (YacG/DUF329 family)